MTGGRRALLVDAGLVVAIAAAPVVIECTRGLVHAEFDWHLMFVPDFAWWWSRPRWGAGWNPWVFGGFPANADPLVGHVHPLGLVWALLPPLVAAAVEGAAAPAIAGLGMLAYLRRVGCGRTGSVVGALAFAGAGYVHAHAIHPEKLRSVLAIPWALAAIEALDGAALVAGLGAAVAVLVAGGHPQTVVMALAVVIAYGLVIGRPRGRRGVALAGGLALGILVPAVTWLPAIELVLRGSHATTIIAGVDRFRGACVATLVVPFACGGAEGGVYGRALDHFPGCGLVDCSSYPGMLPWLAIVAGGARVVRDRRGRFWVGAAVLGLLLATGIVEEWLPVPGVRAPARALLWWSLATAAGAGLVLRPADAAGALPSRRAWIGAAVALALVVGGIGSMSAVARRASAGSLAVLALASGAAVAAGRRGGAFAHAALAGALAVDVVTLGIAMHAGIDPAAVGRVRGELEAVRDALAADGAGASLDRALAVPTLLGAGWASLEHVRLLQGWNVLVPRTASRLLGTVASGDYEFALVRDPALFAPADHALDLLRGGLVLVPPASFRDPAWTAAFDGSRWRLVRETSRWRMFANRRVRPVGWIVHHVRRATADEAVETVHGRRGPFDPAVEALASAADLPALEAAPPSAEPVRVVTYGDDVLALAVEAGARGLLVTSELAYPGWTAAVDGVAVPVHEVDAGLRAVVVAAGPHIVVFTYRPWLARLGIALGALATLGLAAAAVAARRRPRIGPPAPCAGA